MDYLTWEFQVYNVDSQVQQTDASLNPAGCCYSDPVLSYERTGSWELRAQLHSQKKKTDKLVKCWALVMSFQGF